MSPLYSMSISVASALYVYQCRLCTLCLSVSPLHSMSISVASALYVYQCRLCNLCLSALLYTVIVKHRHSFDYTVDLALTYTIKNPS
jgi:flavoprotein